MTKIRHKYDCPFGLAHFDIFTAGEREGVDAVRLLAENNIFWELNVNHDRAHNYRTLEYVRRFMESPALVKHVKDCALRVSVGYDTHIHADYEAKRVISTYEFLKNNKILLPELIINRKAE